jgi:hypothetical protein
VLESSDEVVKVEGTVWWPLKVTLENLLWNDGLADSNLELACFPVLAEPQIEVVQNHHDLRFTLVSALCIDALLFFQKFTFFLEVFDHPLKLWLQVDAARIAQIFRALNLVCQLLLLLCLANHLLDDINVFDNLGSPQLHALPDALHAPDHLDRKGRLVVLWLGLSVHNVAAHLIVQQHFPVHDVSRKSALLQT